MNERIRKVETLLLDVPLARPIELPAGVWTTRQNLLVLVETSAGHRGVGEIWVNFPAWRCHDRIALVRNVLAPLLRDEPLDDPARLHRLMASKTAPLGRRWAAPGPVSHAIAGIDIALWDAFARARKAPLRHVLNDGTAASDIAVYASGVGPGRVGSAIENAAAAGHTRFKVRLVEGPDRDAMTLAEAREAAGNRVLMADPAEIYTPSSLDSLWPAITAARLDWLEEPFASDDIAAYQAFMRRADRPALALGESVYGMTGFETLTRQIDPEIVQPDITKTGGFTEGMAIARQIVSRGRRLCFHMLGGPVGFLASAQAAAAIEGYDLLELEADLLPNFAAILGHEPGITSGRFVLPNGPGLGLMLDESRITDWIVDDKA